MGSVIPFEDSNLETLVEKHHCVVCSREMPAGSRGFRVNRLRRQDGTVPTKMDPRTTLKRQTVWEHIPCRMGKVAKDAP